MKNLLKKYKFIIAIFLILLLVGIVTYSSYFFLHSKELILQTEFVCPEVQERNDYEAYAQKHILFYVDNFPEMTLTELLAKRMELLIDNNCYITLSNLAKNNNGALPDDRTIEELYTTAKSESNPFLSEIEKDDNLYRIYALEFELIEKTEEKHPIFFDNDNSLPETRSKKIDINPSVDLNKKQCDQFEENIEVVKGLYKAEFISINENLSKAINIHEAYAAETWRQFINREEPFSSTANPGAGFSPSQIKYMRTAEEDLARAMIERSLSKTKELITQLEAKKDELDKGLTDTIMTFKKNGYDHCGVPSI